MNFTFPRIAFCRSLLAAGALLTPFTASAQLSGLGGFIEDTASNQTRPQLSKNEIQNFLPNLGLFTFPEPYNTEAIRLTNAQDCGGGDCVNYVGYSYWRNTNNHVGQDTMLIFLGLDRSRGGNGPSLLEYNKQTDKLTNLGPMFSNASAFSWGSGEGWYFSGTLPTKLYVGNGGTEVLRYDVISHEFESVFDITSKMNGVYLWQMHSSDDDRVHSATVRDAGSYNMLGCMAYEEDSGDFHYFPRQGEYDECQVDKSGRWLVIKENLDGAQGEDNRIIDLNNGSERVLLDSDGAAGHSDLGYGFMVAADNWANNANTQKLWRFNENPLSGEVVYHNQDWGISAPAHVSLSNARADLLPEQQFGCGSSVNRSNSTHANEIICFPLDGSGDVLVVAPVMTDLNSSGGGDYVNAPKGNLDVTGQYFIWTSNMGGSRTDAFLVKIPQQFANGGGGSTPTPKPPVVDQNAPVISAINTNIVTSNSATIAWTTNEPATAQVEYGTSTAYGNATTLDSTLATSRFQSIAGLNPGTLYHYRVKSRDAAGNLAVSADQTFTTTTIKSPAPDPVTPPAPGPVNSLVWTDMVNVVEENGVLRKNAGCNGCPDAGASSIALINGNGHLEFTPTSNAGLRVIGLSADTAGTGAGSIDFALKFQGRTAEIHENGSYRGETDFRANDVFRIKVQDGVVSYVKNGTVFHTSNAKTVRPLRADTTFYSKDSTFANIGMTGPADPTGPTDPTDPADPTDPSGTSPMLGHWTLDLATTTAADDSGNNHTGNVSGSPALIAGVNGNALVLDGINDYVEIPHSKALNAFPLSISLWVKTDAKGLHGLVNKYAPGSFNGYQVFVQDGMLCAWYFRDRNNHIWDGTGCTLSTAGVTDNQWHHVVFTVDEAGGTLYVDGKQSATKGWTGTPGATTTTQNLSLGHYQGTPSPYYPGAMDDVRLYGKRLSSAEIAGSLNADNTTPPPKQSGVQAVTWTNQVNVAATGSLLAKTAGCNGCSDAGASSKTSLKGNGYLEFTATADTGLRVIGLATDASGTNASKINFAFRLQAGVVEIRELGVYRGEISYNPGDKLRISVQDGVVTYRKNDKVIHTSTKSAAAPLWADTTFFSMNSAIDQAMLASGDN